MVASEDLEWMLKETLATGRLGEGAQLVSYENSNKKGEDHFASEVLFYNLTIKVEDQIKNVPVVIKTQPRAKIVRDKANTKVQFKNEILMYSEVLPFLDRNGVVAETFPKYYHGFVDERDEEFTRDFVILEDLSKDGYRLTKEKVFLDYDHCSLVMKQIGKFHTLTYTAKQSNHLSDLLSFSSRIKEKVTVESLEQSSEFFYLCGRRGIDPFLKEKKHKELLEEFLKNYDNVPKFWKSLIEPVEPEAVFCHGDFCRNNMLFKYGTDGRPVSVKFFDLQTSLYSSPVIDLSFFLLMNTKQTLREDHWDDLIRIYKDAVSNTIPKTTVPELDFGRVAIYGYLHCSFFLPPMMGGEQTAEDMEKIFTLTPHEDAVRASTYGGKNETTAVSDVIRHLLNCNLIRASYY